MLFGSAMDGRPCGADGVGGSELPVLFYRIVCAVLYGSCWKRSGFDRVTIGSDLWESMREVCYPNPNPDNPGAISAQ